MPQYFPTESVFWALLRIVFWAAVVYAVMRTLWAIWEIPEKLRDIESRLGVLGKEIRDIVRSPRTRRDDKEGVE